jgi:hypothetical protein
VSYVPNLNRAYRPDVQSRTLIRTRLIKRKSRVDDPQVR